MVNLYIITCMFKELLMDMYLQMSFNSPCIERNIGSYMIKDKIIFHEWCIAEQVKRPLISLIVKDNLSLICNMYKYCCFCESIYILFSSPWESHHFRKQCICLEHVYDTATFKMFHWLRKQFKTSTCDLILHWLSQLSSGNF